MTKFLAKALSWILAGVLTLQPVLLYAQDIQVIGPDNGPRSHLDRAYNGTPVLNIGTPNGAGVSHDTYTRFSADDLILNNSATNVDTLLGGWIEGNPNLRPGREAGLWIGEVIGGSRTELNGILEVGGRKMDVILANEYGVTCDGCGFINTDRATLTTGKPIFSGNGGLEGFDVRKGSVLIGAGGLNPEDRLSLSDTARVDLIARAAEIYGKMRADSLNVIAGANRVDYDWSYDPETGEIHGVTEQAGEGAAPALAVDVAALGGMYANAISMVATENGVGVRLNGKLASAGNIGLRSDGRLTLGAPQGGHVPEIKAKKKIQIRNRGPVLLEGAITSEDGNLIDIRTSEGALTFNGEASGGAVVLESAGLASIAAAIDARNSLEIRSLNDGVSVAEKAVLSGSNVSVSAAQSAEINGRISATGDLRIAARGASTGVRSELVAENISIGVAESLVLNGKAQAADTLNLAAGQKMSMGPQSLLSARSLAIASDTLALQGELKAVQDIGIDARLLEATETSRFEAAALNVTAREYGLINGLADIGGPVTIVAGQFTFGDDAEIFAQSLDVDSVGAAKLGGRFGINGPMTVDAATIAGTDALRLSAGSLALAANDIALAGDLSADGLMAIAVASGYLETTGSLTAGTLDIAAAGDMRHSGQIDAGTVTVTAREYAGAAGSEVFGNDITLQGGRIANQGVVKAEETLALSALYGALVNDGSLIGGDVSLAAATDLVNRAEIAAAGEGVLTARRAFFTANGSTLSGGDLSIDAVTVDTRGAISGSGAVTVTAGAGGLANSGALIADALSLSSTGAIGNSGSITGRDTATLTAGSDMDNLSGGAVYGAQIDLSAEKFVNAGVVSADDLLAVSAGPAGLVNDMTLKGGRVEIDVSGGMDNNGVVMALDELALDAAGNFANRGVLISDADISATIGGGFVNSGKVDALQTVDMQVGGQFSTGAGSQFFADEIDVASANIANAGVLKASSGLTATALSGALENDGSLVGGDVALTAATDVINRAEIAASATGTLKAGQSLINATGALISGTNFDLSGVLVENRGALAASGNVGITAGAGGFVNHATLIGDRVDITSAAGIDNRGTLTGHSYAGLAAATDFDNRAGAAIYGNEIAIGGRKTVNNGIIAAGDRLTASARDGGLVNYATLKGQKLRLESTSDIGNAGTVSAGRQLVADAAGTITNVAALISGGDLALYADNILNNSGVIWANGDVTLAGDEGLGFASLVSNQTGRIEAFQGDLTIRADAVVNQGIAPTIAASQIIRWLEQGEAEPTNPVEQITKLIDEAYLDGNGNILPAYAGAYAALWEDVINGGGTLSAAARTIVKPSVTTPSGTALQSGFATLWENMYSRANADGTPDPAALVKSMVDPAIFAADGTVLPEHARAYADLWLTLASGGTSVSDSVKAILNPENALTVESQTTDPATGELVTVYSNALLAETTDVWTAMNAGDGASYDILKILYQDRFNDDGTLAEFVAGGSIDIQAKDVSNVYANMSAGQNIAISADQVTNKALGATQLLVEVHKKPDCFTCHEGEVDYYDTFGGRIEAVGNVAINGNLDNITLTTSELSLQDVIDEMNAYLAEQRAAGDPLMNGIPDVSEKNLELHDKRNDDYTAPVEGNGDDIRKVEGRDTGSETTVDTGAGTPDVDPLDPDNYQSGADRDGVDTGTGTPVVIPVDPGKYASSANTVDRGGPSGSGGGTGTLAPSIPGLTPTKSVNELLAQGINTLAETNPEFTEFSNYITSNYMMDVDRLQYRDELINHNREPSAEAARANGGPYGNPDLDYLDRPVSIPAPDGSGMRTVYPGAWQNSLSGEGALIAGENVTVSGGTINTEGRIAARDSVALTARTINATGGAITAETGEAALTALGDITLDGTKIDANTLSVVAGRDFTGTAVDIDVADAASIFAGGNVKIGARETEYHFDRGGAGTLDAVQQETSVLTAGGDLSIITSGDLELAGLEGVVGGDTSLSAGGDLLLTSVAETAEIHSGSGKNGKDITSYRSHVTSLETGGDFTANAGGSALLEGTQIDAGGNAQLAAGGDVVLAAAQDIYTYEERKSKKGFFSSKSSSYTKEQVTNEGVSIAAGGNLDIIAEKGNLTAAGASLQTADGDISLTAKEGDIYAGAYEDIYREESKKSKSMFFGLISSSSQSSSIDRRNTGTSALSDLDLSLVSGGDTALVGAALEAGGAINIKTGGDFSVQAAIDSQRRDFFSTNTGLVLMTTVQENSYVETAVLSRLLAGQGLNLDIGGNAYLTLYDQAGVDAPLPQDLYPEELLALEGLQLLSQDLANEYFYDETVALSPAFKALVAITIGNFVVPGLGSALLGSMAPTWATVAVNSFASSFLVESLDGMVSGDYDLGDILAGATFSAATAGLTEGISLDALKIDLGEFGDAALLGFGNGNLSIAGILDGALDGMITSGLSSAVYGTDFGSSFSRSLLNTVVNLTLADVQFEIGELGNGLDNWEGSPGHMLLHGLAGCAAAAASGNGCAAGAAGAVAQSLFAGSLGGTALSEQELQRRATVFGALAGYFFSGGDGDNVSNAANIGLSGFTNNYLTHEQLDALVDELTACEGRSDVSACKSAVSEKYEKLDFAQQNAFQACRTSDCLNEHLSQMQFDQKRLYEQVMAAQLRWVDEALAQRILANQMNERALTGNGSVLEERIMAVAAGVSHCEATGQAAGCFARGQALQLISENVGMAVYEALGIAALKPGMPGRGNAGEAGSGANNVPVKPLVDPSTNVANAQRTQHILYGDGPNSGGHLWPGQAGKTPFPQDWDANKVMSTVSDIATDPNLLWKPQSGSGGLYTKAGNPARFIVTDSNGNLPVVDGVPVRVVIEPAGEGIITAFPNY
ncbi:MAG: hemagglutinin repeat-containing protein [Martelella sp.]|uniref:two-partner secretion domain-containing protein n=1 Tax=Martelella sp. TaxID=1969699 RepID=UPI003242FBCA